MDCVPEIAVLKRKIMSYSKTSKRLRRFVLDNSRPNIGDANEVHELTQDADDASPAELVCRVSDETLFQLEQIFEALEAKQNRRATMTSIHSNKDSSKNTEGATTSEATPKKTPSKKKRARESDDPATEMINRRPKIEDAETERARKKRKKARRKSAAT